MKIRKHLLLKLIQKISEALNEATSSVEASLITPEELAVRWSNIPNNLPSGKPLRVVTIENLHPTPCGGNSFKIT